MTDLSTNVTNVSTIKINQNFDGFTTFNISTTTVTSKVHKGNLNIIDIAKYLPIDDIVVGIKLVYAGGNSYIVKGTCKLSKKKKDFLNQVTITLHIHDNIISCKIFHNGTIHITGTKNLEYASFIFDYVYNKLKSLTGEKMISIDSSLNYLCSRDNLIYNSKGQTIGWTNGKGRINIQGQDVNIDTIDQQTLFISRNWSKYIKNIYSLDGILIGYKELETSKKHLKKYSNIQDGFIYYKNQIIGQEMTYFNDKCNDNYPKDKCNSNDKCNDKYSYYLKQGVLIHKFSYDDALPRCEKFNIHMINGFFKIPFEISKKKLHDKFLQLGYYSKYDLHSSCVNLKYKYTSDNIGICLHSNKLSCECKNISISIFTSGKVNVTGLSEFDQSSTIYSFICNFMITHKDQVILKNVTTVIAQLEIKS